MCIRDRGGGIKLADPDVAHIALHHLVIHGGGTVAGVGQVSGVLGGLAVQPGHIAVSYTHLILFGELGHIAAFKHDGTAVDPVSYTHLDVYKRQAQPRARQQNRSLLPPDTLNILGRDAALCARFAGAETALRQAGGHRRQHRLHTCQRNDAGPGAQGTCLLYTSQGAAVELINGLGPRSLMQAVDVLGDDGLQPALLLQLCQPQVGSVGLCPLHNELIPVEPVAVSYTHLLQRSYLSVGSTSEDQQLHP